MKPKLKFLFASLALFAMTALIRAQELVGEDAVKQTNDATSEAATTTAENGGFIDELVRSYSTWDPFKVGWLLATIVFAYGIATLFFKGMLGDRNATTAGKMGCFFGAIAFLGINLLTFGLIMHEMRDYNWVGWAATAVLLIIVFLMVMSGKKVKA